MKKKLLSIFFTVGSFLSFGQNYVGVNTSNYAGVMGLDLQPASFVDGRFKFDLNLGSASVNVFQNFGYFDANKMRDAQQSALGKKYWWKGSFGDQNVLNAWSKPDSTFIDRYIVHLYDENTKRVLGANINLQVDLLNFAFHVTDKVAVGFSAKMRSITNLDNMDPKLAVLAEEGLEYPNLWNIKLNEELLNLNHLTWTEFGVNYGQVVMDNKEHFLKAGGRVKYLSGYTAAYIYTNDFSYNLVNEDTSQYLAGDFRYGYSKKFDDYVSGGLNGLPKSDSKFGLGLDLGVVYEWRPDWDKHKYEMDGKSNLWARNENKYKARVGFSVVDLGGMSFQKGGLSRDFSVNVDEKFDLHRFDNANSFINFDRIIDTLIQEAAANGNQGWVTSQDTSTTFFIRTPSAFSIQADYHIWKWFYVNATGTFNIISDKRFAKVKVANQISLTPSFDYAWIGVHMPITYNEYSGWRAGTALRLGPLTLGFTDFRSLLARGKVRGTEFYAGVRIPVLYEKPHDRDGDKVSDKLDECPVDAGVWAFKGCPDKDGDGVKDMEDECVDVPGLKELNGCPDKDGDGIKDKDDACPDVAGLKEFKGCPDTDGDGITDKEDDCPTEKGAKEMNGCPDTDGDGIRDIDDACPNNAGPKENKGCPDTDGDGIFDFLDDCPTVAGPKENQGCPWPDTDGDGILDKDDDCPLLKGPVENKGCPYKDSDGDGVLDKDDDCPMTPGPKTNKGCPVIEKEIVEILKSAFDNLEFETAKDIIKTESFAALDELATVLTKKSTWKLTLAGHTDNVGDDDANMLLSKKRAEAVRNYLVGKGIATERMTVTYFGETRPIADNATPEGRKKNRRVEMNIKID